MGYIAAADIYLKEFTPKMSGQITQVIRTKYEQATETRKGRVWFIHLPMVHIEVSVNPTIDRLLDVEDDLLKLGHFPDEFPFCLNILCSGGREVHLQACAALCETLHASLESITSGAQLHH